MKTQGKSQSQNPLEAVRQELAHQGCTGFVIPKVDPHQNEEIPEYFDRLPWLTNFTGSAGLAIVLPQKAALFVDGRYTLQAKDQVDSKLFSLEPFRWSAIRAWLLEHLEEGDILGLDPWVTVKAQGDMFAAACQKKGARVKLLDQNPLDRLRSGQTAPLPSNPIVSHPLKYAGQSTEEKIKAITNQMSKKGADTLILSSLDSIAWLLNSRGTDIARTPLPLCYLILSKEGTGQLYATTNDYAECPSSISLHAYDRFDEALRDKRFQEERTWVDPKTIPLGVLGHLGNPVEHPDPCTLPKAIKNVVEQEGARQAHLRDGAAVCEFLAWLQNSLQGGPITELDCVQKLLDLRSQKDLAQGPSFNTIAGTRDHGAIVHYRATEESNYTLQSGDIFLVDSGGQYLDGTTDITRTVALGQAPTPEQKDRFTCVLKGHIALSMACFPKGTSGHQLDSLARKPLWEKGLDFEHGTGHGVGSYLNVHEGPQSISTYPNGIPLEPGMILSNEPGYYKQGEYGIRIESLVLVTESPFSDFYQFEMLTQVPLDTSLIERVLLEDAEKAWVNTYHESVFEKISPLVDEATKNWLKEATQPL